MVMDLEFHEETLRQIGLFCLARKRLRTKLIAAYYKNSYSNEGTKLLSSTGQWP